MASTITADNGVVSGSAGIKSSADSSGVLALASGTGTTAVTIDTSQNVGIGMTPTYKFDVTSSGAIVGRVISSGSTQAFFGVRQSGGSQGYLSVDANYVYLGSSIGATGNKFAVSLSAPDSASTLDANGNLLLGVTSQSGGNNTLCVAPLLNNGNAAKIGLMSLGSNTGGSGYPQVGYNFYCTGTSAINYLLSDYSSWIRFASGKVETFTAASGTGGTATSPTTGPYVAQGGISWTNGSSDVRLKKNFETSQGLAELLQVEPVKYHFNWDEDGAPKRLGFKAQNLLPLIPEMVSEKDELAEDGTPLLTITPDYILPVLVKAIQEQQALIQQLTARIETLEAK